MTPVPRGVGNTRTVMRAPIRASELEAGTLTAEAALEVCFAIHASRSCLVQPANHNATSVSATPGGVVLISTLCEEVGNVLLTTGLEP